MDRLQALYFSFFRHFLPDKFITIAGLSFDLAVTKNNHNLKSGKLGLTEDCCYDHLSNLRMPKFY
jgi:hypothetical protein